MWTARGSTSLQLQLVRLTLATLLPVLLFTGVLAYLLVEQDRETYERGGLDRVRAIASAIDAELRGNVEALRTLALDDSLLRGDLLAFHSHARRVDAERPEWSAINLALPSGEQVMHVMRPLGGPTQMIQERASHDRVVATGAPAIGSIVLGKYVKAPVFAIRVPVVQSGELRYVLSALMQPASIQRLLDAQGIPIGPVATIVDGVGLVVARTADSERFVGQPASILFRKAMEQASEGRFDGQTLEGIRTRTVFSRSAYSGWGIGLGTPRATAFATSRKTAWSVAVGAVVAVLVALLLARWFSGGISGPIRALAARAKRLSDEDHDQLDAHESPVAELRDLGAALSSAQQAQLSRDETRRQLSAVSDNATVALFMMDGQQRCTFMNPAAEELIGYRLDEIQGQPLWQFLHQAEPDGSDHPVSESSFDRAFKDNHRQQGEDVFVHKSGRIFPVSCTASPIRVDGTPVGTVMEVRDVTREHAIESERLELLQAEQRARAESEAANRAKDEFLAMLGHELRNPLGAISNAAFILETRAQQGEGLAPPSASAISIIRRQIGHITHLVDDLLEASRVATGKIRLVRAPVDLEVLVRNVAAALFSAAGQHRLRLELHQVWVNGDRTRLEQIVTNLLSNAVRYTAADDAIEVSLSRQFGLARVEVRDAGIGISSELLPRIFGLFVQGERGPERAQGGLGVGLTLAQRLAHLHGGGIEAASGGAGKGSRFVFSMPAIDPPTALVEESTAGKAGKHTVWRILIIEDNDDACSSLRDLLMLDGHVVTTRADGLSGLTAALDEPPDIALIDIGLPGLSGLGVAQRLRADERSRQLVLVAMTGYGQPEDISKAYSAGFDLHAVKPVDVGELFKRIAVVALSRRAGTLAGSPGA